MENLYITTLNNPPTADNLLRAMRLPEDAEPEEVEEAQTLAEAAIAVAHPKAVLRPIVVTDHRKDTVTLDGVRIECALMAENLRNIHRVFGYVCTCGQEIEAWSQTLSDPLEAFWADTIKLRYVTAIQRELFSTVREKFLPEGYLSHMNPGSLPEWPLTAQRELFALL